VSCPSVNVYAGALTNESVPIVTSVLVDTLVLLADPNCATAVAPVGALPLLQFAPVLQLPFELSIHVSAARAAGSAAATASAIEVRRSRLKLSLRLTGGLQVHAAAGCFKISLPFGMHSAAG
jgi:hypothetical protein